MHDANKAIPKKPHKPPQTAYKAKIIGHLNSAINLSVLITAHCPYYCYFWKKNTKDHIAFQTGW